MNAAVTALRTGDLGSFRANSSTKLERSPDREQFDLEKLVQMRAKNTAPTLGFTLDSDDRDHTIEIGLTSAPDEISALFEPAEKHLLSKTEITAQYAQSLLRRLASITSEMVSSHPIPGRVLAVVDEEDGSATIEYIRKRSRIGFVLDQERDESSWFLVLPNGSSRSGYLYGVHGLKSLRTLLEEFLAAGE